MSKITKIIKVEKVGGNVSYEDVEISKYNGTCEEKALSHSYVMDTMRKTMGRTLTVIDACIPDGKQQKAIKDLVRVIYSDEMEFLADMVYNQEEIQKLANESYDELKPEDIEGVTIEEALGVDN